MLKGIIDWTKGSKSLRDLDTAFAKIIQEHIVAPAEKPQQENRMLNVEPYFCPEDTHVADTLTWGKRDALIQGKNGEVIFEQKDILAPTDWSDNAVNIVASHYFYGEPKQRETSIAKLVNRVCRTIRDWGIADGYFNQKDGQAFYKEIAWLCLHQHASFNSPVWFNVGLNQQYRVEGGKHNWRWDGKEFTQPDSYEYPQTAACFIQSVDDNMPGIMKLAADEAMLFKYGSGTGSSLTSLRSTRESISGGGKPSGPLSFMRIYDSVAGVVKSGGVTRRAALMHTLDDYHPDILEFIKSKQDEELKAKLLLAQGLSYQDVYETMAYQNVNISVRLSNGFMREVEEDGDWQTQWITEARRGGPKYKAKDLFDKLCKATWDCGDPGVQFATTINLAHTCAPDGHINASNPCAEFLFLDDSACNLASINLAKFCDDDGFQPVQFQRACRLIFIAQEILIGRSSYPTKEIAKNAYDYRPVGLGYTNLGSLIMLSGLPYDSDDAREICGTITALMCGTAYLTSSEIAGILGPFERYPENTESMMKVIKNHRLAAMKLQDERWDTVKSLWDQVLQQGKKNGFRNAQATVLAPTGTISFMMDCSTTGIEPLTSLVTYKQLASGGTLELVDRNLEQVLINLGYDHEDQIAIQDFVADYKELEGSCLNSKHLSIFDCSLQVTPESRCISWEGHIRMMAAAQPFISGAISKTVNVPATCTPEEIGKVYKLGHKLGLKAIAIYRDGSKGVQPLTTQSQKEESKEESKEVIAKPYRKRLPDTRESITHKFNVAGHDGFLTVGLYADGTPGELFITMSKEGSTVGGIMDCFGISVSMGLQYGVPLRSFIEKFSHVRFEPQGITKNPDIRFAKSLVDYIFRWLEQTFDMVPCEPLGEGVETTVENVVVEAKMQSGAPACEHCGSITVRSGTCYICKICGHSLGCS